MGGNFLGGNYPGWEFSGWKLCGRELSWVGFFLGGNFPGWNCPVGIIQVAIFQVGVFLVPFHRELKQFKFNHMFCDCFVICYCLIVNINNCTSNAS